MTWNQIARGVSGMTLEGMTLPLSAYTMALSAFDGTDFEAVSRDANATYDSVGRAGNASYTPVSRASGATYGTVARPGDANWTGVERNS